MPEVGIITDSTAQFPTPFFPGNEIVTVLPMRIQVKGQVYTDGEGITIDILPPSAGDGFFPRLLPPSMRTFRQAISQLEHKYQDIIILLSTQLNPTLVSARRMVTSLNSSARIHIIDSQSTATGLGFQVQHAARAATEGKSCVEIKRLLRRLIRRTYTIFCMQSLTYLANNGLLDPAQAIIGEMMNLTPIFALEYGRLRPINKAHSVRNVFDTFYEFTAEIGNLGHITLLKGLPPFINQVHNLRERLRGDFPNSTFAEYPLGISLATILGPMTLGLVAVEQLPEG